MKKGFLLIVLIIVLITFGGCNSGGVTFLGNGDGDGVLTDGDADPDDLVEGDADLDISTDGDSDTADIADDDSGESGEIDDAGGNILLRVTNTGAEPIYVPHISVGATGHYGFTVVTADGERLSAHPGCSPPCDGECLPMGCEPPTPAVRQVLPDDTITFEWSGQYYTFDTCTSDDGATVGCHEPQLAEPGNYKVEFCYGLMIQSEIGMPARRYSGDYIEWAYVQEPTCQLFDITFEPDAEPVDANIVDSLGERKKAFGECGPAWTFSPYDDIWKTMVPIANREGASAIILASSVPVDLPAHPCAMYAGMRGNVDENRMHIQLEHGLLLGEHTCADAPQLPGHFEHILPPMAAGVYEVTLDNFNDNPLVAEFVVEECPECLECGPVPDGTLGANCRADCQCIDEGAICPQDTCALHCLTNRNCPDGMLCQSWDVNGVPVHRCTPMSEPQCGNERDCEPGEICEQGRCLADFDMRQYNAVVPYGMHCGCDAECPGSQRCLRWTVNFTDGMCVFACRDDRDCPDGLWCLPMTQSGLEAICIAGEKR